MLIQSQAIRQEKEATALSLVVLVVDDNEDNLILATSSLELMGIKHLVAMNGDAAIDMAKDKLPDLILLDIVMPEANGIKVTQTLKNNSLTKHIPIIAVTGLSYPHQTKEILDAGCNDYICKPYLIDDLEEKVAYFLNLDL